MSCNFSFYANLKIVCVRVHHPWGSEEGTELAGISGGRKLPSTWVLENELLY